MNTELIQLLLLKRTWKTPQCAQRTVFERHWSAPKNKNANAKKKDTTSRAHRLSYSCRDAAPYHRQPTVTRSRTLVYTEALSLLPCCYWTRNAILAAMFRGISPAEMTARHIQSAYNRQGTANVPGFAFRPSRLVLSPTQRRNLRDC